MAWIYLLRIYSIRDEIAYTYCMNEITIGDKTYISAKRAAEITGYARDYVGQLCREGHVDAKMVGRSWYVYEPAIRAHRFGVEAVQEPQNREVKAETPLTDTSVAQNAPQESASAWTKPTYTPESPEMLPELSTARLEELLPPAEETLTDMQAAWREWFDKQQNELKTPEIESPEVIDERNEAYEAAHEAQESEEVRIPLHQIEEAQEEIVPIRPIAPSPAPASAPVRAVHVDIALAPLRYSSETAAPIEHGKIVSERIVSTQKSRIKRKKGSGIRKNPSNAPAVALLAGVSFIAIAIAIVGTGYASRYMKTSPAHNNPAINFLVGTREFTRQ